jgi:ABC-2 type transport system ATP-binding protein
MVEADELCGRVAIIDRGRILALDTPAELKRSIPTEPVFGLQIGTGGSGVDALRELSGIRSLSHHTHPATGAIQIQVVVEEDQLIGEILRRLEASGTPVLHLSKSEPTLETVFVHMVGRGLDDDAGAPAEG